MRKTWQISSTTPTDPRSWRIYNRSQPARPWEDGDNLPWNDPEFSQRMLREHLDQSHGAASRQRPEILRLVDWLWQQLDLTPGARVLDITCGPGLYAVELAPPRRAGDRHRLRPGQHRATPASWPRSKA